MSLLPDGYRAPKTSKYLKPGKEPISFRITGDHTDGSIIMGWELWIELDDKSKKPVRIPLGAEFTREIIAKADTNDDGTPRDPKLFWSIKVLNRENERLEILTVTQKGIQDSIQALTNNKKWGDVTKYDITITSEGDGLLTKYTVTPEPPEALDEEMMKKIAISAKAINLESLYVSEEFPYGGDPFAVTTGEVDISDIPF